MKEPGDYSKAISNRDIELFKVYRNVVGGKEIMSITDYFEKIVNTPASRFYISMDRAFPVIKQMLRGNYSLCPKNDTRKEMFDEIFARVKVMQELYKDMPLRDIVLRVIKQPAPKFYISAASAEIRICKLKKKWKSRHLHC